MLLKHASNVPQCALAIEEVFRESFPPDVLRALLIGPDQAERLIADPHVHTVTFTGIESAPGFSWSRTFVTKREALA